MLIFLLSLFYSYTNKSYHWSHWLVNLSSFLPFSYASSYVKVKWKCQEVIISSAKGSVKWCVYTYFHDLFHKILIHSTRLIRSNTSKNHEASSQSLHASHDPVHISTCVTFPISWHSTLSRYISWNSTGSVSSDFQILRRGLKIWRKAEYK